MQTHTSKTVILVTGSSSGLGLATAEQQRRDLQPGDPLFREYFVVLTRIPDGYTGAKAPIALTVTSAAHIDVALVELQRSGGGGGGGGLPVTGAQLTGIAMLAMLLLGGGAMFLRRRRDREREDETRSP